MKFVIFLLNDLHILKHETKNKNIIGKIENH